MSSTRGERRSLLRRLFGISLAEVRIEKRGFRCDEAAPRARFEAIGESFLHGYHAALDLTGRAAPLGAACEATPLETRGFVYEGAAMGVMLVARLLPGRRRLWDEFIAGPARAHVYMAHVGAGWTFGALPWPPARALDWLDPLLRSLAFDGLGFFRGYFDPRRYVDAQHQPRALHAHDRAAFDQGLGRAMWFVEGAHPGRVAQRIAGFAEARRGDLWSGVGLAATYAGAVDRERLVALRVGAGRQATDLAQGSAFAAEARLLAGNATAHTELASHVFCGHSAAAAAAIARHTRDGLDQRARAGDTGAYEEWRRRVREQTSIIAAVA